MCWISYSIEDLCRTGSGGTPSRKHQEYFDGTIPWVKSGELHQRVIKTTDEYISKLGLQKSSAKMVPRGALLVAMYGATVGAVSQLGIDAATNQAICFLLPDESKLDPHFFYYALKNKVPEWLSKRSGGAQPNISQCVIKKTKITIPSLQEQKRIAAILDKANAIRRKRQRALELADEFLRSVFLDMFGDPVTNPKGWDVVTLSSIATIERGKFTARPRNDPQFYTGKYPFIQTGSITNADTYVSFHSQTLNEQGLTVSKLFPTGTIAITIAANIGDTGILTYPMCFPDSVIGIQPHNTNETIFLEYLLRFHKKVLYQGANSVAQKNINLQYIKPIKIIRPDNNRIAHFTKVAGKVWATKDHLKKQQSESFFASLQQKAFRGEL